MRASRHAVLAAALLAACSSSSTPGPSCPASVDDGNACTVDSCDAATGAVTHAPVAVDDGNACTTDACDPATGVSHTPVATDDGDACTTDTCDAGTGAIAHTPIPVDDGVTCTLDACSGGVVSHAPDDAACAPGGYCDPTADCVPFAVLEALEPLLSYAYVGQVGVPTIPTPVAVRLSGPARADTFVTVATYDSNVFTVSGGGVTVPAGATSAPVLVSGVGVGSATISATLDGATSYATVRVLDGTEQPVIAALSASSTMIVPGATVTFTVTLDLPAPAGGSLVALAVAPAEAGTAPATVTVPEGQLSATFDYVDAGAAAAATVTASLGTSSASRELRPAGLVINEVDYDQPSTDFDEFVEIYNPSGAPYDLTGVVLYLVNGATQTSYLRLPLSGTLEAGGYALVASTTVVASPSLRFDFANASNNIQNGAPDAITLVHEPTLRVLDSVTYEGALGACTLGSLGIFPVMETASAPTDAGLATDSLCRLPDGLDTDDNSADFHVCSTPTPGAANAQP